MLSAMCRLLGLRELLKLTYYRTGEGLTEERTAMTTIRYDTIFNVR